MLHVVYSFRNSVVPMNSSLLTISLYTAVIFVTYKGKQILQNSRRRIQIVWATRVTERKVHTEDP